MAQQGFTCTKIRGVNGGIDAIRVTWASAGDSDTFQPVSLPEWADKSIQVVGTFGGASIALQGSNDATSNSNGNYAALNDAFGNTIAITSAGIKQVTEVTAWVKPVTSGGSSSALVVTMLFRRVMR